MKNTRELVVDGVSFIVIYCENSTGVCIELCVIYITNNSGQQPKGAVKSG